MFLNICTLIYKKKSLHLKKLNKIFEFEKKIVISFYLHFLPTNVNMVK